MGERQFRNAAKSIRDEGSIARITDDAIVALFRVSEAIGEFSGEIGSLGGGAETARVTQCQRAKNDESQGIYETENGSFSIAKAGDETRTGAYTKWTCPRFVVHFA